MDDKNKLEEKIAKKEKRNKLLREQLLSKVKNLKESLKADKNNIN